MFVQNPHRMVGQDGAFSIPLGPQFGDETLWFFGDTLVGTRPADHSLWTIDGRLVGPWDMSGRGTFERMINNTGLLAPKQTGERGVRDYRYITDECGSLKNLIPLEGDEHPDWDRIWCQHGICIGGRVVLSFIKVKMLEHNPGPLPVGFEIVGSGLAVGSPQDWSFRRITRGGESILWRAEQPHFASAFLHHRNDGHVYLYGSVNQNGRQNCYLACVEAEHLTRLERYNYLASPSPRWSQNIDDAIPLFGHMPSELSVSFNEHLGCYLAVHSLDLTGQLVGRTAPDPWGPWSEPTVLWTVRAEHRVPPPYPLTLIYAGKEHPELAAENGRKIYLTYIEFEEYFPHLVEVTLG
jgi:hypothetical protein